MECSIFTDFLIPLLSLFILTSITNSAAAPGTNTEFIRKSCTTTMYPTLCLTSLSTHADTIQESPELLAHTALSISFNKTISTSAMMVQLFQSHKMSPREIAAMQDCVEVLGDSVDELRDSLGEMSRLEEKNFKLMISDIQTWVSAALTDDDTCMDGFGINAVNDNIEKVVKESVSSVAHLTSIALALVNNFASVHG